MNTGVMYGRAGWHGWVAVAGNQKSEQQASRALIPRSPVLHSKLKANPSLAAKLRSMAVGTVWDTHNRCRSMASTLPGTSSCMHTQFQAEYFSSNNVTNVQSIDAQQAIILQWQGGFTWAPLLL